MVDDDGRLVGHRHRRRRDRHGPAGRLEAAAAATSPERELSAAASDLGRGRRPPRERAGAARGRSRGRATGSPLATRPRCGCAAGSAAGAGSLAFLAVMGPGLIAGIAGNDAGGITTYSVLGARDGPTPAVALPDHDRHPGRSSRRWPPGSASSPGQGLSDLIRDRFGVRWTVFAMVVLLVANVANTVAEFAGASAAPRDLRHLALRHRARSWRSRSGRSCSSRATGPSSGSSCRSSLVFVTYIASAVLAHPDWGAVGRRSSRRRSTSRRRSLLLMVAVVGTTITPYMQFYLQSAVAEKGIDEEELRLEQADAIGGVDLDQRHRGLHRHRDGRRRSSRRADRHHDARPTRPRPSSRSPATSPRRCSRSGCSARRVLAATIMPISTAFVICEAFGWESGVGKRFSRRAGVLRRSTRSCCCSARWSCSSRAST